MKSRTRHAVTHLRSRRSLLLALAAGAAIVAAMVDGIAALVAASVAIAGFTGLVAVMSYRLSQLKRSQDALLRTFHASYEGAISTATRDRTAKELSEVERASRLAKAIRILDELLVRRDSRSGDNGIHMPLVSVVIPCFNEELFIGEAIQSVAQQTFDDWECLVVDDASTDSSLAEIWRAIQDDQRFRVLRHKVNSGLGASRNTGLRAARGRFVTFLDGDDLLMRDSLMDRIATLSDALLDLHVIGSYCGVRVEPEEISLDDLPSRMGDNTGPVIDFLTAESECPFNAHAPLLVTDTVRRLGGFNEQMRHGAEDWDLWYRAMRNGYVFVPSRFTTAVYRQKRQSMVRAMPDGHMAQAERLIDAAFHNADPDILRFPAPTQFMEPLSHYQALIRKADRAIRFATMALVRGDESAAQRALQSQRMLPLEVLQRHLDVDELVRRGMRRVLAIKPTELIELKGMADETIRRVRDLLTEVATLTDIQTIHPPEQRRTQALLVPQHAGQLHEMLHVAGSAGFKNEDVAMLNIAREAGDQGASREIPDHLRTHSLNEWVLNDMETDVMFVGSVRVGVVDELARAMVATGGKVLEVPQRYAGEMRIAEAHRTPLGSGVPSSSTKLSAAFLGRERTDERTLEDDPGETWRVEEYPETTFDAVDLARFKDRHRGERVVVIGNGPSLNECDLSKIKDEHTIAVNAIFYAADSMGFDPTYYVVEDTAVIRDNLEAIKAYNAGHKFFPSIYRHIVGEHRNVSYFMMNRGFYEPRSPDYCIPRFSFDPTQRVFSGQSVTIINLQLAYYLGFEEVVLIGMDFSYTVPNEAHVEGDIITSTSADPNHFHPDYFGPGKVWKNPKLDRVLANYALAKEVFEADGRRIVNATIGGKLELFERIKYDRYFT